MCQRVTIPEVFDNKLYNNMQLFFMQIYLEMCIKNGDKRNKNEILAEWIKDHSAEFRLEWCKNQTLH